MAASTSRSLIQRQQNISMLLEKLKELTMDAESTSDGRIFGRIEGNFSYRWNTFLQICNGKHSCK